METAEQVPAAPPLKPYSSFFHPHKAWIDILLSLLMPFMFRIQDLAKCPVNITSEDTHNALSKFRANLISSESSMVKMFTPQWVKHAQCDGIVEHDQDIAVDPNILIRWGLVDKQQLDSKEQPEEQECSTVGVAVFYPSSLFPETTYSEERTERGTIKGNGPLDLSTVPLDVPILVYFHGGGMIIGSGHESNAIGAVISAMEGWKKATSNDDGEGNKTSPKPVVIVNVHYRLSPENPFPAALIDAFSVVKSILDIKTGGRKRRIHIGGVSAGGNLAVVAGLEFFRRYPDRIASVASVAPMLDPACDSESYFLNSQSSGICPVDFLLWSWRAYLGIHTEDLNGILKDEPEGPRGKTNQAVWDKCQWKHGKSRRLIEPYVDIPKGLDKSSAPKFLVSTNAADPLMDEGVRLYQALEAAGANVTHIAGKGSHVVGNIFDLDAQEQFRKENSRLIFG